MRLSKILAIMFAAIFLVGCKGKGRDFDQFANGPSLASDNAAVSKMLSAEQQQRLIDLFPQAIQPFADEIGIISVDYDSSSRVTLERRRGEVNISWRLPTTSHLYLRISDRPLTNCPDEGSAFSDGVSMLEAADSFPHAPRAAYERISGTIDWNLLDPAYETYQLYYMQGCLVDRTTGTFSGDWTNTIVIELVDELPDLYMLSTHIFNSGPSKGETIVWVRDSKSRSDLRGDTFEYSMVANHGGTEIASYSGMAIFDPDEGAVILPGDEFVLPADGRIFDIEFEINNDRSIPESEYGNNIVNLQWQVNYPAVLVFDRIRVNENCDQRSPGEWKMDGLLRLTESYHTRNRWTIGSSNYFDTNDFTDYPRSGRSPFLVFGLDNMPVDATLELHLQFFDCNKFVCGEEWHEHPFGSARDSWTGVVFERFSPDDRVSGIVHESTTDEDSCGFTGVFRLMNPDRARSEGLTIDARIPAFPID